MVRRHCNLSVDEFRGLCWQEQELIREGLRDEFDSRRWKEELAQLGAGDESDGGSEVEYRADNSLAALANLGEFGGFRVREV